MGGGGGVRGSPLPSRPPHLPHPRSRSLDTALDKASDSNAPIEGTTPHSGSVAGSLTDSAMPDSVPGSVSGSLTYSTMPNSVVGSVAGSLTDSTMPDVVQPSGSVSDVTAATSDTDASDSGVFSRCHLRGSKGSLHKGTHKKPSPNSKGASEGNTIPAKSSFRRANKNVVGSREDLRSSGRHKTKSVKNTSDVPSGKVKPKSDKTPARAEYGKTDDVNKQPKFKMSSGESGDKTSKIAGYRSLDVVEDKSKFSEVDPYNTFYSKKIAAKQSSPAAHSVKSVPSVSKESLFAISNAKSSQDILGSERPQRSGNSNPYISPVISSVGRRERSPQPSSPSPSPSSSASGLRSPSLISFSSTCSLPHKKKDSVFSFPRQTNTLSSDARRPLLAEGVTAASSSKLKSGIPQSHISREATPTSSSSRGASSCSSVSDTSVHKSESEGNRYQKETCSSPFDARPRYTKNNRKSNEDIDLRREGSHIDLVASCEKYLEEEELHNVSDDESTLASTRRSSISSLGSSSGRLRRRLSSIPLDDDLTIAEEDQSSPTDISRESPAKSCGSSSPHEMAIFSAIHALSQSGGGFPSRDNHRGVRHSGDYDGVPSQYDVEASHNPDDESPSSQDSSQRSPSSSSCASSTPVASKKTVPSNALSNPSNTLPSKIIDVSSRKAFDQNTLPAGAGLTARVGLSGPSESAASTQPSSSLLDKCVNRVKTFIKK